MLIKSNKDKNFNLLPMYKIGIGDLSDGLAICLPQYCKKKKNDKCEKFYEKIFCLEEGLYTCPYGFNAYVCRYKDNIDIFTGFRVEKKYNNKKADGKIVREDINRVISYDQMEYYIDKYKNYIELSDNHEYLQKFIENIVHDIRKFNANIKTKGTLIVNKSKSKSKVQSYARNIWAMSSYISTRLDIYNYLYLEQSFKIGELYEFNFYKTFDKIRMCFTEEAKKKNMSINIHCNGTCDDIKAYSSIELLPFLIIDNALKYTSQGENINISVYQTLNEQIIKIEAIGAKIEENELENIFDRRYRGKNSKKYCNDGSGIGLYLAKKICDANNLKIEICSSNEYEKAQKKIDEGLFKMIIYAKK